MAIRFGPQATSSLSSRLLLETRVLTVAAPAYLHRHGTPADPAALTGHDCIQFLDPRTQRPFEWIFQHRARTLAVPTRGSLTFVDVDTMVAACVAGAGVAQVLALGVERLLASGALVELFPDWPGETFPLYAVRPSRRLPPARVQAFVDFCINISRTSDSTGPATAG